MAVTSGTRRPAGRAAAPPAPARPRRRSRALAVIGVLVVTACALVFAALLAQAGNRQPVLAVVRNIAAGQLLTAADLQTVQVGAAGPVALVPAAGEASVLGRPAAAPLPAGALLTSADIGPPALPRGQDDLGVAVKAGQYPPDLAPGQAVDVLATPDASSSQGGSSPALPVGQAVVLSIGTDPGSGVTVVELRLSQNAVPQVAAIAATGQIALAAIPGGG
jgi:hypothetical protein